MPVVGLPMTASLIGHWGSSAFRLSTTAASMSLTGSRFSSHAKQRHNTMSSLCRDRPREASAARLKPGRMLETCS
jgi:hypothetical protein